MRHLIFFCLIYSCTALRPTKEVQKNEVLDTDKNQVENTMVMPQESQKSEDIITAEEAYPIFTQPNGEKVKSYCDQIELYFKKYNWGISHCHDYTWNHVRNSSQGNPIVWFVFGDDKAVDVNTTMLFCGVHGDEITPIKFCFDLLNDLSRNPSIIGKNRVVIAPLVTPDSFLTDNPSRTNAQGVDVNRNFPTKDWAKKAISLWKNKYHQDKRRFPGKYALSEQETIFQVNLINRYNPNKIISVHAPLTLLDYDGPTFSNFTGQAAKKLLIQMSDSAGNYKVSNYPFFTGSLGNWAGNERNIPTYTLELPNSDWNKTEKYFEMFRGAIHHAIQNDLSSENLKKKLSQQSSHD